MRRRLNDPKQWVSQPLAMKIELCDSKYIGIELKGPEALHKQCAVERHCAILWKTKHYVV